MKRILPDRSPASWLMFVTTLEEARSPETLGTKKACCLRCPDEPCIRFNEAEIARGNTSQVCPVDAIQNAQYELGPTVSDNCIGCGICVIRCPIGAISLSSGRAKVIPPSYELTAPVTDEVTFLKAREAHRSTVDFTPREWTGIARRLTEAATSHRQDAFYGLVASLFTASGHPVWRPPRGDTSNRIDLILIDETDSLPVEVKSRTESPTINVKSVQQALENRILMDRRNFAAANSESSTLVVGYEYPPLRSDVTELVEDIEVAFGVIVGLISLSDLYLLALRAALADETSPRYLLSTLKGRLS